MNLANKNFNPEVEAKLAELKKVLPVLLLAPYTRILFLAGSVADGLARPESDIDLIVVAQNNRVWLNKFFLEILARAFKIKRTKNKYKNKICFNMFLSNEMPCLPHQNFIGASSYKNLKPIWGKAGEIKKFWETNLWLKNFCELKPAHEKNIGGGESAKINNVKNILEKFLDKTGLAIFLEKVSYKTQTFYLKNKFNKVVADKNSNEFDFEISPSLIAYHFPVSNYNRAVHKQKSLAPQLGTVDNQADSHNQPPLALR